MNFAPHMMETFTGKLFDLRNPTPEMVCIEDIAHHLSHLGRYCGAAREFMSVAQHSVLVCDEEARKDPANKLRQEVGLLHDAHEAYMGDWTRPLVEAYPELKPIKKKLSDKLDRVIAKAFGLPAHLFHEIKDSDNAVLLAEAGNRMKSRGQGWGLVGWGLEGMEAAPCNIPLWSPSMAEDAFLSRWRHLA